MKASLFFDPRPKPQAEVAQGHVVAPIDVPLHRRNYMGKE